ncbi:MAG TPA: twin-arginine translocation signal domain-containing protein, partial [Nitrosospira sp.]
MTTRRQFFKLGIAAGAAVALPWEFLSNATSAFAFSQSDNLTKFIQPLRGVGGSGIPVAQPDSPTKGWVQ